MKLKVKKVDVEIEEKDALDIINALNAGFDNKHLFGNETERSKNKGAQNLLKLLKASFQSSLAGVHRP